MNFVNWNQEVFDEFCKRAVLKPREREVLRLHVFTDWTCEFIGDKVNCSAETVKRDIKKCKHKYLTEAAHNDILRNAIYKDDIKMTLI